MTWLASVLPGVREIRGPLVAGYLWMLNVWLLAGSSPFGSHGSLGSIRLQELTDVLGPVGLAASSSLLAYLVGSLSANLTELIVPTLRRIRLWLRYTGQELEEGRHLKSSSSATHSNRQWYPISELLTISAYEDEGFDGVGFGGATDRVLEASLQSLIQQELAVSRGDLGAAVERAETAALAVTPTFQYFMRHAQPIARIPLPQTSEFLPEHARNTQEPAADFDIPTFSPQRDLFDAFPFLRGRLAETAPIPSSKIERLFAEAEFRITIAFPLFVLSTILALDAHGLWVLSYALPVALSLQAYSMGRNGNRELLDALRARSLTEGLDQITPAFDLFRTRTKRLIEAIDLAAWRPVPKEESLASRFRRASGQRKTLP